MKIQIPFDRLTECDGGVLVTEASDIPLTTSGYPDIVDIQLPDGRIMTFDHPHAKKDDEGDVEYVAYSNPAGKRLKIFND